MARTTHTTATERLALHHSLAGIDPALIDGLADAVIAVASTGNGIDLSDLKGAIHNLVVVTGRSPEVKARRAQRGLDIANAAKASGGKVSIAPSVSPKRLAYLHGTVERIDAKGVLVALDIASMTPGGTILLSPSLVAEPLT